MIILVQSNGKVLMLDLIKKTLTIKTKEGKTTFEFEEDKLLLFLKICGGFYEGMGGYPDGEAN